MMKPSLTTCAVLSLAGLLAGCHHMPTRTDAVSVTDVLDELKKELNAFANDSATVKPVSANGKNGCPGIHKVTADTVTVTLTTVGTRQVDGSVTLGIPVFETNFSGTLSEKETSKLVLPLQLVDTGDLATQNIKNMPLASALGKLRDELLAVNSAQKPCFSTEKDKRITLELSFEATRSGKGGVTLNVAPLKLATGGNRSSSATQTVAIGLKLEGVDGGSGTFQNPTQKPVQ
jgi:Trypsin-co-occurring domain 2